MKLAIQTIIILSFWATGEGVSNIIFDDKIPGSLIGMVLLLTALCTSVINEKWVQNAAQTITKHMVLFFTPAAVGVITSWATLKTNLIPIILTIILSTAITIAIVGVVQQKLTK